MSYLSTLINILVAAIFSFSIYAVRKNYGNTQWRMIFTENLVRWALALIVAATGAYIIVFVPEFAEFIKELGPIEGKLTVGVLGAAIGAMMIGFLPSDDEIKRKFRKRKVEQK